MSKSLKKPGKASVASTNSTAAHNHVWQKKKASTAFHSAKQRCTNPNNPDYPDYGGKGIKFLMSSFAEFWEAHGPPPSKDHSLDRIDPHGHYEIGNLRWAVAKVQANNKKATKGAATLSHSELISKHQSQADQKRRHVNAIVAFGRTLRAIQRGYFTQDDKAMFDDAGLVFGDQPAGWRMGYFEGWKPEQSFFKLPSLTHPGQFVTLRGGPFPAGQENKLGLLKPLAHEYVRELNIPEWVAKRFSEHRKETGKAGAMWIGQVSPALLAAGGFEGMMLSIASVLRYRPQNRVSTCLTPMRSLLMRLEELGPSYRWDEQSSPILVSQVLFVPDFQLDLGAGFDTSPQEYGAALRLLEYRRKEGFKTFVGVQNPVKLLPSVQKELYTHYGFLDFTDELVTPHPLTKAPETVEVEGNDEYLGLKPGQLDFADLC